MKSFGRNDGLYSLGINTTVTCTCMYNVDVSLTYIVHVYMYSITTAFVCMFVCICMYSRELHCAAVLESEDSNVRIVRILIDDQ